MPGAAADDPARPGTALVILAAGAATRFGRSANKVLQSVAGRSVLTWSLAATEALDRVTRTLLVVREEERRLVRAALDRDIPGRVVELVGGGTARHESEHNALRLLAPAISDGTVDLVVIHDAARPLAGRQLFIDIIRTARAVGGAVPGRRVDVLLPEPGTDGGTTVCVQTPQAFRAAELLSAYQLAATHGFVGSDTSSCAERFSDLEIRWVPGPATNIKITFAEDLRIADRIVERARAADGRAAADQGPRSG